jgi:hypothetical protein
MSCVVVTLVEVSKVLGVALVESRAFEKFEIETDIIYL